MTYSPLAIANTFIERHGQDAPLNHMKIQKLIYFAYGWWLAYHDSPLTSKAPEVWRYGPVFSGLYTALSHYGHNPIRNLIALPSGEAPWVSESDKEAIALIDTIFARYGLLSETELSSLAHAEGTPWKIEAAANNFTVSSGHTIPDDLIRTYFSALR